ncbi:hypothetical protein Calag_0991 [Caldisphaera lagunensis DSM 15908]|uniref:Uncharacterized protein n=1 Tax=Caldisphaera lagunensis (strain DSM 15908 / JCM 11604 / ANMR 0165 / IC-154) TaxID=1056495 RepID=L0ABB9_CALLD|nr:hypothetical protein [Caldisphaera lagunensis]AFZ70714.1 hypothetical protein Calag_0991 [Caldisphaera lagunensis DSM 15908]
MGEKKKLKDLRGSQSRIFRLRSFYLEGFIHAIFYRIQIPVSIIYGIILLSWLFYPGLALTVKAFTALVWILFIPQLFESVKGLALSMSRGMVFGKLNNEYAHLYRLRYKKNLVHLRLAPYLVLAIWIIGFIAMIIWWYP